jgi:hypothetical protein
MILNFASTASVHGVAGRRACPPSKGAALSRTRSIAVGVGDGIRVNRSAPVIATPVFESVRARMSPDELSAWDAALKAATPSRGRPGMPTRTRRRH